MVQLESATAGRQAAELSYLTGGLSWRADYVAELVGDESQLDLAGWVTLTNQSGTGYENARLQIVAGDVNRVPLPKGVVRVYKKDSRGNVLFIGEDRIDHTAKNEAVRLKLGDAFDVKAARKQTSFRKIADRVYESAYGFELSNAKDAAVTVKVAEPVPGDWEMVAESQKHAKGDAHSAVWLVRVPAQGKATLDYTVRIRW